jgi:HNH endonuclease
MRIRIGERDRWVCGICRDPQRPVRKPPGAVTLLPADLVVEHVPAVEVIDGLWEDGEDVIARDRRHPLAAVVDHIVPRSDGGTDDPDNLQIAHWRCNALKHYGPAPVPAYAAAVLSRALDRTPIPARVWQQEHNSRVPLFLLDRGEVAVEPWRLLLRYQVRRQRDGLGQLGWIPRGTNVTLPRCNRPRCHRLIRSAAVRRGKGAVDGA